MRFRVLLRPPRRGAARIMTVPARELRIGDRVQPKQSPGSAHRHRIVEIRDYSSDLTRVPTMYLVVLAGRHHAVSLYLQDDMITIERRARRIGRPPTPDEQEMP